MLTAVTAFLVILLRLRASASGPEHEHEEHPGDDHSGRQNWKIQNIGSNFDSSLLQVRLRQARLYEVSVALLFLILSHSHSISLPSTSYAMRRCSHCDYDYDCVLVMIVMTLLSAGRCALRVDGRGRAGRRERRERLPPVAGPATRPGRHAGHHEDTRLLGQHRCLPRHPRSRRQCLPRLVWELGQYGVGPQSGHYRRPRPPRVTINPGSRSQSTLPALPRGHGQALVRLVGEQHLHV